MYRAIQNNKEAWQSTRYPLSSVSNMTRLLSNGNKLKRLDLTHIHVPDPPDTDIIMMKKFSRKNKKAG